MKDGRGMVWLRPRRVAAGATLALTLVGGRELRAADAFETELRPVSESVFVAIRPDVFREPYESNTTLIINESDVVVVDSGSTPLTARRVIAALKKLTPKPVSVLVNTHWHYDHVFGNQEYAAAFPGVEIVSHPLARQDMLERSGAFVSPPQERAATVEAALKSGHDPSGAPLSASERRKHEDYLIRQAAMAQFQLTPPTLTVEQELVLRRGEREIRVSYLGRGHTNGDLVVFLPKEKILVSGDLIVIPISSGFSSFPHEWAETMRRLDALPFATLIPGHGEVQHDREAVRLVTDALDSVNGAVDAAVRSGVSLEETRRRLDLEPLLERCAASGERGRAFFMDFFAQPVAEAAFREAQAAQPVR